MLASAVPALVYMHFVTHGIKPPEMVVFSFTFLYRISFGPRPNDKTPPIYSARF